ncbi:hypothetical protein OEZ85_013112 [Tetradesmus obliquus]|uniref:Uncharacterized protein n=1 Tax=Tetradesmus obliquus TaxID=3088 RepID=A0ABY8U4N7_TETOB|nr:hypothetical protein OEZ85_013112 [Tetradesmus obliquus]
MAGVQQGEWQPEPAISHGWPFTLQLGTVGLGIGVGCGVGVGFGGPVSLATVPVLGQASQGISAGLGSLSTAVGGAGAAARAAVQQLGIRGFDAGFGCGVGLGYGFGAGLMLKPSAAQQLLAAGSQAVGEWCGG